MAQPNNIILSFENAYTLSGNNTTDYYYKDGNIYWDGSENENEPKFLDLSAEQANRITRLKSRTELTGSAGTFTTQEGIAIDYEPNDEIYVAHNYVDNDNINRDYNSSTIQNSWWYDTKKHRSYKVYTLVRYIRSYVIADVTYYDWRVVKSFIAYKDASANTANGSYKFTTLPANNIDVTASVKVESFSPTNPFTWEEASLNVYKNGILYTSSLITYPDTSNGRINVEFTILPTEVVLDDMWDMSVSVGGDKNNVLSPLIVPEYTMSFNTTTPPVSSSFLGFVTPDNINDFPECQPTFNNAVDMRQSLFLSDVDYSTGINTPQNIELIVGDSATKASTPDSNYSQYSHTLIRYFGVKTNRTAVNTGSIAVFDPFVPTGSSPYAFTTDNLGAIPNVELLNSYTGYFNRIVDPYPLLNNKTAYFVKFLVDQNGDVLDPSLSIAGLNNILNTYRISDINRVPTKAKASIISQTDADELKDLEEFKPVYKVAEYPSPILYSQNSSNAASNTITLTDGTNNVNATSPFFSATLPSNTILLEDTTLNSFHDSDYIMEDLTYTPGPNKNFPNSIEPSFTKFPSVKDSFKIQVGDELRFENNELLLFRVNSITQVGSKLQLTLDKTIPSGTNLNFFVLRRFKPISNYVILNQQKPYDSPPSASSAPGILSTQYQVSRLDTNPDDVISGLIEKGLI